MNSDGDQDVLAAQRGEPGALERLIMNHQFRVRRLMARLAPMQVDPDDLAQDVFVTVVQRLQSFDARAGDFKAWVFGIARHIAYRSWESSRVRKDHWQPLVDKAMAESDRRADLQEPALEDQIVGTLSDCVQELGPKSKELVQLRYNDQLPFEQIAQNVRQKTSSVRMTLTRIRAQLRECLQRKGITALESPGGAA